MKLAVLGVGAIGGPVAGQLTRAGYDVVLIDQWPTHVEAMRRNGLKVTIGERDTPEIEYVVPVRAYHPYEVCTLTERFDFVFLACKSYDSRWHAQLIEPVLASDGAIVSLQNSLNPEWIAPIVGAQRTIGGVMLGGGELLEPGWAWRNRPMWHRYYKVGELEGPETPRIARLVEILSDVGRTETTSNYWGLQWSKLVLNTVSAALSALCDPRKRSWDLIADSAYRRMSLRLYREGATVVVALGYQMEPLFGMTADELVRSPDEVLTRLFEENSEGHSRSAINMVQQDLLHGRPTEVIGYFNGLLSTKGRLAGVPTPVNDAVVALYQRLETGELTQSMDNLRLLEDLVGRAAPVAAAVS